MCKCLNANCLMNYLQEKLRCRKCLMKYQGELCTHNLQCKSSKPGLDI